MKKEKSKAFSVWKCLFCYATRRNFPCKHQVHDKRNDYETNGDCFYNGTAKRLQWHCNGIAITLLENFLGGATDYNMTCKTLFEFLKSLFNHYPNIVLTSWRTYSKKQKSILHTRRKTHFTIARIIGDKKQSDILVILQIITIFVGL